jgi:Domain of unknown function (DUF5753)/Domain of unknown function (DUF397)
VPLRSADERPRARPSEPESTTLETPLASPRLQTEGCAHAVLSVSPGVSDEVVAGRLAGRMARQQRALFRPEPPSVWFVVDEMALYRRVGSPETMAAQMRHLGDLAALPNVTLTVMPAVIHPANESGFVIADNAAYAEHVAGGYVFTEQETATSLAMRFDSKSSYSGSNGGQCVEVASVEGVIVRDTTDRDGVILEFNAEAWSAFAASIRLS